MKSNRIGTDKNLQPGGTYDLLMVKVDGTFPEGKITFGLYDVPMKITGLQKVAQHVLRVLLTSKGSDPFYPYKGTHFPSIQAGSNITENSSETIASITEAVSDASRQVRAMLNPNTIDKESTLDNVQVLGVSASEEGWFVALYMLTLAGEGAEVAVPFPQFGIDPLPTIDAFVVPAPSPAPAPSPPPPIAGFTLTPSTGVAPLSVSFTDTSTGNPTSWAWDFGNDGIIDSIVQNPTYIFNSPGTYDIKLTVSNAYGSNSAIHTAAVVVSAPVGATLDFETLASTITTTDLPVTTQFNSIGLSFVNAQITKNGISRGTTAPTSYGSGYLSNAVYDSVSTSIRINIDTASFQYSSSVSFRLGHKAGVSVVCYDIYGSTALVSVPGNIALAWGWNDISVDGSGLDVLDHIIITGGVAIYGIDDLVLDPY
jgi:PKD repeat protein